jgi:hypothetical protein
MDNSRRRTLRAIATVNLGFWELRMAHRKTRRLATLCLEQLETRVTPTLTPYGLEAFDTTSVGSLPPSWLQWSSTGRTAFSVSSNAAFSAPHSLAMDAGGFASLSGRAWFSASLSGDVQVSADVLLNSLIPAQVLARGLNLYTTTPSFYAVTVTRGLTVQLVKVVNGVSTTLEQLTSSSYFSNGWARVTLLANGSNLRAQVYRPDTAQYLNAAGAWQSSPAWALNETDTALPFGGQVGMGRPSSYAGQVNFDDFTVFPAAGDNIAPTVSITAPPANANLTGIITVQASATDNVGVTKVEFYIDSVLRAVDVAAPFTWSFDTSTAGNGTHTLAAWAYDAGGNIGKASITLSTQNDTSLPQPKIPQHYPNIRIAELAYTGNPMGATEDQLLRNSVDLVIAAPELLAHIKTVSPTTPALIYANLSNLYTGTLTDWLNWADAHGVSREEAFFHAAMDTPFSGDSASSLPVNWFWAAYRTSPTGVTNQTSQARGTAPGGVTFGTVGQSIAVGYPDPFREVNLTLTSFAGGGWSAALEYPMAVDAAGNPTAWAPLRTVTNSTLGLMQSGQITFDPPPDWKTASLGGSTKLYYVRFRTLTPGLAPVASLILGRDFVNAHGTKAGVIPAFDTAADVNHDGYLSDAEFAHHATGESARFLYESRMFYGTYGQMRPATNPADIAFRAFAVQSSLNLLRNNPLADGLFFDNSAGVLPVNAATILEPVANYALDYGSMLNGVGQAINPHWELGNTAGGGTNAAAIVQRIPAYIEEYAIRPMAQNLQQFEDLSSLIAGRQALRSPAPFAVLDSLPTGGSPTDPRTQLAALAYYYLLADPSSTFLDFFGGFEPASTWSRHWSAAAAFNVGLPSGGWSVFVTGADPANPALSYRVYQRRYANALVLYKPLSYANGITGTLADATATTHNLGGNYRVLQADGTLGPVVTSVTLRNGEGAILVKA